MTHYIAVRLLQGLALCAALLSPSAQAHKPSDAYLTLTVDGTQVEQRFDIALRDIDRDLVLDANDDGLLTWAEVKGRWSDIDRLASDALKLSADGQPCQAGATGTAQLDEHSDGRYAVLTRRWQCAVPVTALAIDYTLFARTDPSHRGVTQVRWGATAAVGEPAVLVAGAAAQVFHRGGGGTGGAARGEPASWIATVGAFVIEGVHHILIGADHILFLLSLLLPVVLVAQASRRGPGAATRMPVGASPSSSTATLAVASLPWTMPRRCVATAAARADHLPAERLQPVLISVLKVVTAFTIAHSITLALAALDIVNPPSRWIESVIAASVVLAALNNIFPVIGEGRWKLTFVFGLVHGFGFASVLKDLGLTQGAIAAPLLGFNVGVELGQLMIVSLFLPIAWRLRKTSFYRRWVLGGGSLLIVAVAMVWLVERVFDLSLIT